MKKRLEPRTIATFFGFATVLLFWISMTSYRITQQLVVSFDEVSRAHQAVQTLQHIDLLLESAESNVRGYVITGNAKRLDPFRYARTVVPYEVRQLEDPMSQHPDQQKTWKRLKRLISMHLAFLSRTVELRRLDGSRAAGRSIQTQLENRRQYASAHSAKTKAVLVLAGLTSLGLLAWAFSLLNRETYGRRHAESATQRTETFLDSIVERIPYMILVKEGVNLRLTVVNRAAEEWLGRSREELLGSNEFDWRSRSDAQAAIDKDREVLRQGKPVDIPEERLILPGKEERILHTQKIPVPDDEGNSAYLLTISEDITQRKLAERMLELSRDAAVESARLKSEFIGNMSHEIRTPLAVVSGMTTLLMDTELTAEQRQFARKVQQAAEGLSAVAKGILDFSKIEAGTFALDTQEVNVREIVEGSVHMLREQAKVKGITLASVIYHEIPPLLRGDPARLRQVITQLIGNAVKFTKQGEVLVRVTEARQNDSQVWLNCRITDTGIGISENAQKHLFEAFRQGDGSPTRKYGGTGLGLAISKRIVELMGGEIGYETVPGKGSTFWFSVPFNKAHVQGPVMVESGASTGARARILVVDENETVRQMIQKQLRTWGLASEAVSSGQTALALLRQEQKSGRPFLIAIVDMNMPDMDGVIFARLAKNDAATNGTKLLVMSADEATLDSKTATTFGFAGRLSKPPKIEELQERLAALLESHKPLDQPQVS
jgi:two-component system sensor histidine kinase/response regulator